MLSQFNSLSASFPDVASVLAGVTAGNGISISGTTISNSGVLTVVGTANQTTVSPTSGFGCQVGFSSAAVMPGSLEVTTTLQVDGNTASSFLYSNASKQLVTTSAPTNGQLLIGSTGAVPVSAALTQGTGITITNGAGSITVGLTDPAVGLSAASSAISTTETVVTKRLVGTAPTAGSLYVIEAWGTCTSTAANTTTFKVRIGTNGTTGDTSLNGAPSATAATSGTAVPFHIRILVNFYSATSVVLTSTINNNGTTGLSATQTPIVVSGSATTITNANNFITLTAVTGASTTAVTFTSAQIYQIR